MIMSDVMQSIWFCLPSLRVRQKMAHSRDSCAIILGNWFFFWQVVSELA